MSQQDILYHVFTFLDYSHTITLSLVCKEWNQIANSNSLWEFYFHLLSNNTKGKTKVATSILSEDDLFWKKKIKDYFSKYSVRLSKKIIQSGEMSFKILENRFPDLFSSQVVKMIMNRIFIESLESSKNVSGPFTKQNFQDMSFGALHLKLKCRISGIDEPLIVRCYYDEMTFALFGYGYVDHYYLYFALESDDKSNDLTNMVQQEKAFTYKFNGKNRLSSVCGTQYLCDKVLSILVPTLNQFEFSPLQFVPYWCFLFSILISNLGGGFFCIPKEVSKHYPNLISNRLCYHFFKKYYSKMQDDIGGILNSFNNYKPKNDIQDKLYISITKNKQIPRYNPRKRNDAMYMTETIQVLNSYLFRHFKFAKGTSQPTNLSEEDKFKVEAQSLARIYQLCKNPANFMDSFLAYKFKRTFQISGSVE